MKIKWLNSEKYFSLIFFNEQHYNKWSRVVSKGNKTELSKSKSVNFLLIESVIWLFTNSVVKKIFSTVKSVKFPWLLQWKLTGSIVKNIFNWFSLLNNVITNIVELFQKKTKLNSLNLNQSIFYWLNQWKLTELTVKNICSLLNRWKSKSLIQLVKIWLIHI